MTIETWVKLFQMSDSQAGVTSVSDRWCKWRNFLDGNHHARITFLILSFQHQKPITGDFCWTPWKGHISSLFGPNYSFIGCSWTELQQIHGHYPKNETLLAWKMTLFGQFFGDKTGSSSLICLILGMYIESCMRQGFCDIGDDSANINRDTYVSSANSWHFEKWLYPQNQHCCALYPLRHQVSHHCLAYLAVLFYMKIGLDLFCESWGEIFRIAKFLDLQNCQFKFWKPGKIFEPVERA